MSLKLIIDYCDDMKSFGSRYCGHSAAQSHVALSEQCSQDINIWNAAFGKYFKSIHRLHSYNR